MKRAEVVIRENLQELSVAAVERFVAAAQRATRGAGVFRVSLSGGSTPKKTYELLGSREWRDKVEWRRVHLFWGDERFVTPDHPDSNYGMVKQALLDHLDLPYPNQHPVPTTSGSPDAVARAYEQELRRDFNVEAPGVPSFNFMFLGIGDDGHTASLFPGSRFLDEDRQLVIADETKERGTRISFTFPVLNAAKQVVVLVAGSGKAQVLREVLSPSTPENRYPAQRIAPAGELTWLVDREAARLLDQRTLESA